MVRGGATLPEAPAFGAVVQIGIDTDAHRVVVRELEAEAVQRQREPHATRFDVRLLESPVLEEAILLPIRRSAREFRRFGRRKKPVRDVERNAACRDVLDIYANL